jgi:hypothetical protein
VEQLARVREAKRHQAARAKVIRREGATQ